MSNTRPESSPQPEQKETVSPSVFEKRLGLEPLEDIKSRVDRMETIIGAMLQECHPIPKTYFGLGPIGIQIGKMNEVLDQFRTREALDLRNSDDGVEQFSDDE